MQLAEIEKCAVDVINVYNFLNFKGFESCIIKMIKLLD